jgi:5'(3')-deoxyribonucleotidase
MDKIYIVQDVDLTIVDSSAMWFKYLENIAHKKYFQMYYLEPDGDKINYDLSVYYPELTKQECFSFWKNPHLYDNAEPIIGSVDVLTNLDERFHVTFASMAKPEHYLSKYNFIKKHFGDKMKCSCSFVSTFEKGQSLKANIIIDDRVNFHNQFDNKVLKVLYKTNYTQEEQMIQKPDLHTNSWYEIGDFINDIL